jgi:hypothetical protein
MIDQVISPLRRRMIEDMAIRKFAPKPNMTTMSPRPRALSVLIESEPGSRFLF